MSLINRVSNTKQTGVSLVEVLVAVVVISVGLLGVAALQISTLQNNHNSLLRTQANALADDILDRIRANRANATFYARALGDPAPAADGSQAQNDLVEWYGLIQTLLPAAKSGAKADGQIVVNTAAPASAINPQVTITIQWGEGSNDPTGTLVSDAPVQFVTTTGV